MCVYLLHFSQALHHAQHYIGSTDDLERRIEQHRKGNGARLVQVFCEHDIDFVVARVWDGDRKFERVLKNRKNGRKLCPICNPSVKVDQILVFTSEGKPRIRKLNESLQEGE